MLIKELLAKIQSHWILSLPARGNVASPAGR